MIITLIIINSILCILVFVSLLVENEERNYYQWKINTFMYKIDDINTWTLWKEIKLKELEKENNRLHIELAMSRVKDDVKISEYNDKSYVDKELNVIE